MVFFSHHVIAAAFGILLCAKNFSIIIGYLHLGGFLVIIAGVYKQKALLYQGAYAFCYIINLAFILVGTAYLSENFASYIPNWIINNKHKLIIRYLKIKL